MKNFKKQIPVSIIVPVYNVEGILLEVLESIVRQKYPIKEIIIIDNKSTDNSLSVARTFGNKYRNKKIKIIQRDKTYGISSSYNLGAKLVKTEYFVTLHSDSALPTENELSKLMAPVLKDSDIIATYPLVVHPRDVWLSYNFWQKCLFATVVGKESPGLNGKFDCYKKEIFLKIGGYDEKRYSHFIGAEDANMHWRLKREGKIVPTEARVLHLHGNNLDYSLKNWIDRRKFLAITYGRYLKIHSRDIKTDIIFFLIKPALVFLSFLIFINPFFIVPLVIFPFFYLRTMFVNKVTLADPKILILPLIVIFLVFYETYWMLKSLFFLRIKV